MTACGGGGSSTATTTTTTSTVAPTTTAPPRTTTTKASTTTEAATTTTTVAPTTTLPPPVRPLTGLPLDDPGLLAKPAVIVKVSNDPGARPQTGLNEADIVYEAWGAGPTRFGAIFHSQDNDFVGPIRSCREQDVNLFGSFNAAVFACSGGNPGNVRLLRESDMLLITEGQGPGWSLDPHRGRPHKTHGDTALFRTNAGPERTAPLQQYNYRGDGVAATAGSAAAGFDLTMQSQNHIEWRYDAPSNAYLRSQAGRPHTLTDGSQVSSNNVVIAWLDYQSSSTDAARPTGRARAAAARSCSPAARSCSPPGRATTGCSRSTGTTSTAQPVLLTPGRTFVELANSGNGSFSGGGDDFTLVP